MSIDRPMFPPGADSVDSIIRLSPPDDRPNDRPLSDSRKPGERPSAAVVRFPGKRLREHIRQDRAARAIRPAASGINMHDALFRSYDLILKSDEADLIRDVGRDIRKAEIKLKKVRQRLQGIREQSAAQIQQLTAADTKLSAAIVAALLSTRKPSEG
ncbi:MAG TPA: hypothetical protein VE999_19465 [Gemmataceae bacterium]|nr:hypothetical protein [Gemmataceae bacterium]